MSQAELPSALPPKKSVPWGWIVAGLLVGFLVVGFALKAVEGMVTYYVTVEEFVAHREDYVGKKLKIAGRAEEVEKVGDAYSFKVALSGVSFPVTYTGFAPDTFKEGVEVVVEGRATEEDVFRAEILMAKCASKYEVGGLPPLEEMQNPGAPVNSTSPSSY